MKYCDLVQFEPLDTVIQLEQAGTLATVRQLVQTYVISPHMAEQLCTILIPNLQLVKSADNKGILTVGNYGTGKSHVLSLISGVAEYPDLVNLIRDQRVAEAAKAIAGQFKVVRVEIPATKKSLRKILCGRLQDFMASEGLSFNFPADDQVDSNKDDLSNLMNLFHTKYPHQGLLLVVDELLDYLRARNHQDIILDLGFLREIGEVCKLIRFRFIAGLQESLFDNPKFQFVADSLRRVKDRFEQLRIVRQDVAYVVSERLLAKTDAQRARVREHLQTFTPLYGGMAERLEEFVRLFPVHPTYLEMFQQISIAEKREVLKTIQGEMERRLNDDVPQDQPGIISYDSYWEVLQSNAVLRVIAEIRDVIDMSKVVETKVQYAFTRKALQPMAVRIIHGLSVHRLTTDDVRAKIGLTAEELQNGLCLLAPLPENSSDFLRITVETCLKEIMKTVSGQFITHNVDNGQYYLDQQKIIDYEEKIQEKADTLSDSTLDQYYFAALTRALELTDQQTYVRDSPIWEHEIEWPAHKITRRGYLFFGAPNERSTVQPPRDFYLYFLQPFEPPYYEDQHLADEVFFKLTHRDPVFDEALRRYAGAREMAASVATAGKKEYGDKAEVYLKTLTTWLRANLLTAFEVMHQGVPKKMVEWLKGQRTGDVSVGDLLKLTGSVCLAQAFEERYPQYPSFTVKLFSTHLKQPTEDVLRWLAGGMRNQQATAVLDGLELLDGDKLKPGQSRYAQSVLDQLTAKPPGQVVNRKDLVALEYGVEREAQYRLELEFLLIILVALAHHGYLTLSVAGKKLDAGNLSELTKIPLDQLLAFKHIEKPKGLPLAELVALFDLLKVNEGLIRNENTHEEAVKQLRLTATALTERVVILAQQVQTGLPCWGAELVTAEDQEPYRQRLDALKTFLEGLQAFNTPGKLKNFTRTVAEIQSHQSTLMLIQQLEALQGLVQELTALTSYLIAADAVMPPLDPWRAQMKTLREAWQAKLLDRTTRSAPDFRQKINRALLKAKDDYRTAYFDLHKKARLDINGDDQKKHLLKDPRLGRLKKLTGVSLFQHTALTELQSRLSNVQTCFALGKDELETSVTCPHCHFRPQEEDLGTSAVAILGQIDQQLDALLASSTQTLLDNLDDPTARRSINLLPDAQKAAVEAFLAARQLPEKINNELVQGIQQALSGLIAIPIKRADLLVALSESGAPCTIEQLQSRFEAFVQKITGGKEPAKVRLVMEPDVHQ